MLLSYNGKVDQFFEISRLDQENQLVHSLPSSDLYRFIWIAKGFIELKTYGQRIAVQGPAVLCISPFHPIDEIKLHGQTYLIQYNKEFYCIIQHDMEVSCAGVLFYSPKPLVEISLDEAQNNRFLHLLEIFEDEFSKTDRLQGEMLRILLKRFIIVCTRRMSANNSPFVDGSQAFDNYRKFILELEMHFKQYHDVAFYSNRILKSAKTLANQFKQLKLPSPVQLIHQRIMLEAKHQLLYTTKNIAEISNDLGFEEAAHFSRFFAKEQQCSPSMFRQQNTENNTREKLINENSDLV